MSATVKFISLKKFPVEKCKNIPKFPFLELILFIFRALHVSFGGLILRIESIPRYLTELTNGSFLYILMNKL